MARPREPGKRDALLERAVTYVLAVGVVGLALRPMAAALRTSPRLLLYHFGSKERLVAEVVTTVRRRLIERLGTVETNSLAEVWRQVSEPSLQPYWKLLLEVYALGLRSEPTYGSLLPTAVGEWLGAFSANEHEGVATLVLAAVGGLLLDLVGTGDRRRVDGAARLLSDLLREGGPDVARP